MDGARYLEDGRLVIFKRSGIFYARIRISISPVKYTWRSLKTSDEQTAVRDGRRLLFQLEHRAEQGFPLKSKLFSAVIDDYIAYRERDHAHGRTTEGIRKHTDSVYRDVCVGNAAAKMQYFATLAANRKFLDGNR